MSRIGITSVVLPVEALGLALSAFEDNLRHSHAPATRTGLLSALRARCNLVVKGQTDGSWTATLRGPWPSLSTLHVAGDGEKLTSLRADFGYGRVVLPRKLLEMTGAVGAPLAIDLADSVTGKRTRWTKPVAELLPLLANNAGRTGA